MKVVFAVFMNEQIQKKMAKVEQVFILPFSRFGRKGVDL